MVWFQFTEDFNFTPADKPAVTVAYKADREYNVTRECAEKAHGLGRGAYLDERSESAPVPAEELAEAPQFSDEELDEIEAGEEQVDLEEILATEFADHGN